jgi:8-oxo-dGTP diphosphatase
MTWKDSSGRALADYPRPSLAVDVALLTVSDDRLCVVLHRPSEGFAAGQWSLPGTFVRVDERLSDAALRALHDKAAVTGRAPRQLRAFDALDRDERGRVVSIAHVDLVPVASLSATVLAPLDGERVIIPGRQRRLPFDHDEIVGEAAAWARLAYRQRPDPEHLLGKSFTLFQLRKLHAAVLGEGATPAKDTFRRYMQDYLDDTGVMSTGRVGKPARLFQRH